MADKSGPDCLIAIIGGGAAGLSAAISAASELEQRDFRETPAEKRKPWQNGVVILERQDRVGRKILATGNGRCNLSHSPIQIHAYHGKDPSFIEPALSRFGVRETLEWFASLGLYLRIDPDGRIFPYSYQASAVLDLLRCALDRLPVAVMTNSRVLDLKQNPGGGFTCKLADGRTLTSRAVIVATGGLAAPAFGCEGDGYQHLTRLGHRLVEPMPALVQICTDKKAVLGFSGIRVEGYAALMASNQLLRREKGEILFTDYGLSGPPILQLSRKVNEVMKSGLSDKVLIIDFLPDLSDERLMDWLKRRRDLDQRLPLEHYLTGLLHKKIGMALIKQITGRSMREPVMNLTESDLRRLSERIKNFSVPVIGTRSWDQAQVTAGGIDVSDFDAASLSSRIIPGLYAAGEVLDIDGDCGGYNLQWAWSSGRLAGEQAVQYCRKKAVMS